MHLLLQVCTYVKYLIPINVLRSSRVRAGTSPGSHCSLLPFIHYTSIVYLSYNLVQVTSQFCDIFCVHDKKIDKNCDKLVVKIKNIKYNNKDRERAKKPINKNIYNNQTVYLTLHNYTRSALPGLFQ